MSLLTLEGVEAAYRRGSGSHEQTRKVLHGVSLSLEEGRVTAVLGPNGAGKTTLLNVALGWHRPDSGRVLIQGQPLAGIPAARRGQLVSLVPQQDHIPFEYSILEYVLLGRAPYIGRLSRPSEADVTTASAAIAKAGLAGRERDSVLATSAGERELVLLARSLAQDPALLLLDEPSAHLDLANKRRLAGLVRAEAAGGRGVLVTVHEPEFAVAVADAVVLMKAGEVVAAGPPDEVLTSTLLSATYDVPVEVARAGDRTVFLW